LARTSAAGGKDGRVSPQAGGERRTLYTPGASSARCRLERASAKPLLFLHQLRWVIPVVLAGLLVAGLVVRGPVGAVALILLAAVLAWLAALSWPALSPPSRLIRAAGVIVVLAGAALQAVR
jgi:hypothetical protein